MSLWQLVLISIPVFCLYLVWRIMATGVTGKKIRFFKLLVGLDIALSAILFVFSLIFNPFTDIQLDAESMAMLGVVGLISMPIWFANLAALVGLLMLKNWARYLYFSTALFMFGLSWPFLIMSDVVRVHDVMGLVLVLLIIFISFLGKIPFGREAAGMSVAGDSENLSSASKPVEFTEDVKSKKEIELSKVEEMFKESKITEDERNKLRAKILGID